eukprot:m.97787 g.97787  ORF g.97787 m.97787 type:complete len:150 (+) comp36961_c0_seq2:492-941(+)
MHEPEKGGRFCCPVAGCGISKYRSDFLCLHLQHEHNIDPGYVTRQFLTWNDFLSWKATVEEESHSAYTKVRGCRKSEDQSGDPCEIQTFACCRDGFERPQKAKEDRKRKRARTRKLHEGCVSRMVAKCAPGAENVDVTFVAFIPTTNRD